MFEIINNCQLMNSKNIKVLLFNFCLLNFCFIFGLTAKYDAQNFKNIENLQAKNQSFALKRFCLGTGNGRNTIRVDNSLNHYERLNKSFYQCQRIIGNLEITHIDDGDLLNDYKNVLHENGSVVRVFNKPFHFFEHIEEVTGYLLIFNVRVNSISFPRLKIIWGEKTYENNALQVDSCNELRFLNFPALRSIENGFVSLQRSPQLCYMQPEFFDYSQILGRNFELRLKITGQFSPICNEIADCPSNCKKACFGPEVNQCQIVYRRNCNSCASNSCFLDDTKSLRCCDEACAGGCYGDGKDKCVACKNFEQDGKCVNECRGIFVYKSHTLIKENLSDNEKRYFYGRHCVKKCPSGTLVEDKYCVARCSNGFYRNGQFNDRMCVPCNGICPKVCQMTERIDSANIRNFVNCSEIEGNLEIFNHVFTDHAPDVSSRIGRQLKMIPALKSSDLDIFKSVRIITGHVVFDGGKRSNSNMPTTLSFLENLEMIEGRHLYFEKYSLYIIGNRDLKCYSIPFSIVLGVKDSSWQSNMNTTVCENSGYKCDLTCDPELGCWGPGPKMCVRCRNFIRDGSCADTCPQFGYFVAHDNPRNCIRCHPQCLECFGTQSTDCKSCQNYELWTQKINKIDVDIDNENKIAIEQVDDSKAYTFLPEKIKKCVSKCPNSTYIGENKRCESCHDACYEFGCTGPNFEVGKSGCKRCRYGVEDEQTGKLKCLVGETEEIVCGQSNNIPSNYYIGLGTTNMSKYMCRKCRDECLSCTRESTSSGECECAKYKLVKDYSVLTNSVCVNECGKGSFIILNSTVLTDGTKKVGICMPCHKFCDERFSCFGSKATECERCASAGIVHNDTFFECLMECPIERPFSYEGFCHENDKDESIRRRRNTIIAGAFAATILFAIVILYLVYRCTKYRKKYEKEAQMHLPEIPALDPRKVTQRPNMRRLNLIAVDELDDSKNNILGSGAFGIVYAGKWKPPTRSGISIPVAIKAINPSESRHITEAEMMKEAGLMATIQHEHLLPLVGICVAKGGIKIVTILRPLGSLLKFLDLHKNRLGSKNLMLYCFQMSSAMEFLAKKKIVHRDLAARNVLVKNINHVEVTDFGLAQMLQGSETAIVVEGRVAVKWLAIESLRQQIYTERTDVWSFGVTCWEILTCGQSPYKELRLPRDQRLVRELATQLEKGYRLMQPANCSQELYQEILNCWLVDPDSRPSFRQIKEKFEMFCRAPHIYIQERQATQRMDSITSSEQRLMIERLLQDSDFLDPVNIDPAEYASHSPNATNRSSNSGNFFSTNTMETVLSPTAPCTLTKPLMCGEQMRQNSAGTTNSSRYKSDPITRKYCFSTSEDSLTAQSSSRNSSMELMDEENYLMPRTVQSTIFSNVRKHSLVGKSINEETSDGLDEDESSSTTALGGSDFFRHNSEQKPIENEYVDNEYFPTYLNELESEIIENTNSYANNNNYKNDSKKLNGLITQNNGAKCDVKQIAPYINVQQHETPI